MTSWLMAQNSGVSVLGDELGIIIGIVILIYLLAARRVPGYPISYPVGYPGNELPDNGSPIHV